MSTEGGLIMVARNVSNLASKATSASSGFEKPKPAKRRPRISGC
jgi:hypothetical protein